MKNSGGAKGAGAQLGKDALGHITPEQLRAVADSVAAVAESSGRSWEAEEATEQATERHTADFYAESLKHAESAEERERIRKAREEELDKVRQYRNILRSSRTLTQRGMAYLPALAMLGAGAILVAIGAKYIELDDVVDLLGRD